MEYLFRLIFLLVVLPLIMVCMFAFMVVLIMIAPIATLFGKFTINDIPFKEWWGQNFGR